MSNFIVTKTEDQTLAIQLTHQGTAALEAAKTDLAIALLTKEKWLLVKKTDAEHPTTPCDTGANETCAACLTSVGCEDCIFTKYLELPEHAGLIACSPSHVDFDAVRAGNTRSWPLYINAMLHQIDRLIEAIKEQA